MCVASMASVANLLNLGGAGSAPVKSYVLFEDLLGLRRGGPDKSVRRRAIARQRQCFCESTGEVLKVNRSHPG